jgi:hypothetical protein
MRFEGEINDARLAPRDYAMYDCAEGAGVAVKIMRAATWSMIRSCRTMLPLAQGRCGSGTMAVHAPRWQ